MRKRAYTAYQLAGPPHPRPSRHAAAGVHVLPEPKTVTAAPRMRTSSRAGEGTFSRRWRARASRGVNGRDAATTFHMLHRRKSPAASRADRAHTFDTRLWANTPS
ncbi:hypothetical protein HYPSUDRAFT_210143 [Hypholoma sublateritium FD-334 SS-4]|uniref:Uncharacterized protein n=1 Tax=Hypholoma sublateritium (strain FD-334 SS-4) TaxID=945553 RepID=A0A0D2NW35_HYPSF|nr:hypothetical protein HYPSUDRAFT_210143 [Hypholoma sublateritium FD-334 SS-4]